MDKNSKKTMYSTCSLIILLAACGGGKTVKTEKEQDAAGASTKSVQYKVNTEASSFKWTGKKKLVKSSHTGTIELKKGHFKVENNKLVAGKFVVDMQTIKNTEENAGAKLVGHLSSEDFFHVEKYPESVFEITNIEKLSEPDAEGNNYNVSGNLTIKDKTHNITFPAKVKIENGILKASADFGIDRTKWGIKYGSGKFFKGLGDKVIADKISFDIELTAEKQ